MRTELEVASTGEFWLSDAKLDFSVVNISIKLILF